MPVKRPFGVTLLLLLVLCLSAWGAIRFAAALRWRDVLYEFESSLSPLYLSITGAGWGVAGGVLLFGILNGKSQARPAVIAVILLWLMEYWIERIFFQSPRANLPFAVIASLAVLAIAWIATYHASTRLFFTRSEAHEQPDENPAPE
jgi:hypothetical protein